MDYQQWKNTELGIFLEQIGAHKRVGLISYHLEFETIAAFAETAIDTFENIAGVGIVCIRHIKKAQEHARNQLADDAMPTEYPDAPPIKITVKCGAKEKGGEFGKTCDQWDECADCMVVSRCRLLSSQDATFTATTLCCCKRQHTPFCGYCGKKLHSHPLEGLLRHVDVCATRYERFEREGPRKGRCEAAAVKWRSWHAKLLDLMKADGYDEENT